MKLVVITEYTEGHMYINSGPNRK